jgi:2-polyprenyl-3-methyl-5-hydroxy-6-metoxy-1,4-benzoquinol methylase/spore coat polysaccharide biosynthesis predicted glycosyltransferase SpsG
MTGTVLVVPCCEKGKGGGHLTRCIKLTKELRGMGKEAYLFIPDGTNIDSFLQISQLDKSLVISENGISEKKLKLIILDRYQTPHDELARWKTLAPVTGIDEGGPCRASFDFLIDILIPENFEKPSANITSCGLLDLPKKRKNTQDTNNTKNFKILISFGQEDAAELGLSAIKKLAKMNLKEAEITLLKGGLNNSKSPIPDYVKALDSIPNLADHLCEYDLVITHYGITAYEALYAGTQVLLDHPAPYHKKIAKAAGFTDFNKKNLRTKSPRSPRLKQNDTTLANLINSFSPQVNRSCPVCGKGANSRSIARFPERTYHRCNNCGIIHMDRTCPPPIEYEREYFFEAYKKQYGKTYLEDFPNLVATAKRRLKIISRISSRGGVEPLVRKAQREEKSGFSPLLLDIGCAYGPFLVVAKEEGFSPVGIDPAEDAVRYVQETLGISAVQGFFPNSPLPIPYSPLPTPHSYDVITLWYVIEHFRDSASVLAEIKKLLTPGGILAFSTPSYSGISGRKSLRKFLEKSPADHYTIWSPKACKKALALAGFKVKKITISGHHPERFPLLGKFAKSKKSPLYWLFLAVSKIFGLGDTFEVYAKLL